MNFYSPYMLPTNRTNISQTIQQQLTPTLNLPQYFEESSSILSLSNYLQQEDSSLCFQTNSKKKKWSQEIEKKEMFNEIQCAQKIFMKHLGTEFVEQNSEESESMLLTYSSIKENKLSMLENTQYATKNQKNTNFQYEQKNINHQSEGLPSRIKPKVYQLNNMICSDSVELLELLAIPNDPQTEKSLQNVVQNDGQNLADEMLRIKQIYQIFQSNKDLFDKMNTLSTENDLKDSECANCEHLSQKLQNLEAKLELKLKEIKKYQKLIQKLNSTIFDLKIQNKQLFFQNKQYSSKIQKFLEFKSETNTIQRLKTVSYDYGDNSLDQILKESNGISSSYTNLSRKTTKLFKNNYDKNVEIQKIEDKKNYPQTPMPSSNHLKCKKQRRSTNHSNKQLEISISQVKQPTIYQIQNSKDSKILKQHNRSSSRLSDKKTNFVHKSEKNVMRFSDLSKEINEQYIQYRKIQSNKKCSHQPLSQKSPTKVHGFLKIKTKNIHQNIQNLKDHPLNKISQEDNNSQTSETKTQKLYGFRKSSTEQKVYCSNDSNFSSIIKAFPKEQKHLNRQGSDAIKIGEVGQKNSIIYKSFKQIGCSYENDYLLYEKKPKKKQNNVNPSQLQYGSNFYCTMEEGKYGTSRNREKYELKFVQHSPKSLKSKRQNDENCYENCSPQTRFSPRQIQMKSFVR